MRTISENPNLLATQAVELLKQEAGIAPEVTQLIIKDYTFSKDGKYVVQEVQAVIDFGLSAGWLDKPMPPSEVYTNDYLT